MRLKTYLMLCILTFSIGSGIGFVWPTKAQQPQLAQSPLHQSPTPDRKLFANNVIFDYQPDSPLQPENIIDISYAGGDEIGITLKNTSNKTIRAYGFEVLSYSLLDDPSPTRSFQGSSSIESKSWIPAHTTIDTSLGLNFLDASKVKLRLDFVEFADGTTWGKDSYHYHDMVLGFRAGMLAATQKLLTLAATHDVTSLLKSDLVDLVPTQKISENWLSEFKHGVQEIQSKLRKANNNQQAKEILWSISQELKLAAGSNDVLR
jgi:hypothetical protein